eukprot:jgi/Mesen1/8957/ME000056S08357
MNGMGAVRSSTLACRSALAAVCARPAKGGHYIASLAPCSFSSIRTSSSWKAKCALGTKQPQVPLNAARWRLLSVRSATSTVLPLAPPKDPMFYSSEGLQRAAERRTEPDWLAEALAAPDTLIVPIWQCKCLVKDEEGVLLAAADLKQQLADGGASTKPIFLGLREGSGKPVFALDVTAAPAADGEGPQLEGAAAGARWVDLRREGPLLPAPDAALLAYARGLMEWHSRNRFCARCGCPLEAHEAGHNLKCTSPTCRSSIYPRLDPAVIMLVTCNDYVLLGRQARWEAGRFSLLAGFVELSETFEMAVAREVLEEAGVAPWPFPSSLMIGFTAQCHAASSTSSPPPVPVPASATESPSSLSREDPEVVKSETAQLPTPHVDTTELQDARWVHRDFLRAVVSKDGQLAAPGLPGNARFSVPGKYAIARILLERWATATSPEAPSWGGSSVPAVDIDAGVFKYVLMRVTDAAGNTKLIVRGYQRCPFHMDVVEVTRGTTAPLGLQVEPLGGGRIEHRLDEGAIHVEPLGGGRIEHRLDEGAIHVYGFSQAFGQADHAVAAALLRRWYPLHQISTSNDGY